MARAFIHLLRYFAGLDPAQTQTTLAERDCIARHARGKRRAVEIGVFEGVTTGVIAAALDPTGTLYAIDPFLAGRLGICWGKPIAKRESRRFRPRCQLEFVEAFSHQASQRIGGEFDFLFIDGDHSWDGIAQDWSDWSPRIALGGIIGLHDTRIPEHHPAVAQLGSYQYFNERIIKDSRFRLIDQVDSLSILQLAATAPSTPALPRLGAEPGRMKHP